MSSHGSTPTDIIILDERVIQSIVPVDVGLGTIPDITFFTDASPKFPFQSEDIRFPLTDIVVDVVGLRLWHNITFAVTGNHVTKAQQIAEQTARFTLGVRQRPRRFECNMTQLLNYTQVMNGASLTTISKLASLDTDGFYRPEEPISLGSDKTVSALLKFPTFVGSAAGAVADTGGDGTPSIPSFAVDKYVIALEMKIQLKAYLTA